MAATAAGVLGGIGIALGFRQAKESLIVFNAEMESTQIGLATVRAGATGTPFADALGIAAEEFKEIRKLSLDTAATGKQLFEIYQGALGAVLGMGKGLKDAQQISFLTSIAASALRVDFAQASRDLNMMLSGRAGMDVRLFQNLRTSGFIKQTAEEFNKIMLQNPQKGFAILKEALEKTRPAAEAYGKSWEGLTSTFADFTQIFQGALGKGIFEAIKARLTEINAFFKRHETQITETMTQLGNRIGKFFTLEGAKQIGTVLAGAVAAKFAVGLAGGLIGGLPGIVKFFAGGLSSFAGIFAALPILIPVLVGLPVAILAIGGVIWGLSKNLSGLRDRFGEVLKGFWSAGSGFIQTVQDLWPKISLVADVIGRWTVNVLINTLSLFTSTVKDATTGLRTIDWKQLQIDFASTLAIISGFGAAISVFFSKDFWLSWSPGMMSDAFIKARDKAFEEIFIAPLRELRKIETETKEGLLDSVKKSLSGKGLVPQVTVNQHIDKVQLEYNFDQAEPRIFRRFEKDLKNVARRGVQSIFALDVGP